MQHKSPCSHLLFFAHMNNFVQPVLSITFGLHWHFDSTLSAMSSYWITVCFVTFGRLHKTPEVIANLYGSLRQCLSCQCYAPWTETSDVKMLANCDLGLFDHHEALITVRNYIYCRLRSLNLIFVKTVRSYCLMCATSPLFYWDFKKALTTELSAIVSLPAD